MKWLQSESYKYNKAIVDIRLRPRCAIFCHCIRRQSQAAWRPLANTLEVLTARFNTAPTSILSKPRATWPIIGRHDITHKTGST